MTSRRDAHGVAMITPRKPVVVVKPEPVCGKGTKNGEAASVSRYGFAPCCLRKDHPERDCDSGPALIPEPPEAA